MSIFTAVMALQVLKKTERKLKKAYFTIFKTITFLIVTQFRISIKS